MSLHQQKIGFWMILLCFMTSTLHAEIVISDVVGSGDQPCLGSFHLTVNGNAGPFDFEVEKGGVIFDAGSDLNEINQTFYGLCSGFYSVMIENSKGCINYYYVDIRHCRFDFDFNINPPLACNSNDGRINVGSGPNGPTPIGGAISPYHIEWSNGEVFEGALSLTGISSIGFGTYTVTVTDSNGCMDVGICEVISESSLHASIFDDPGDIIPNCDGFNNGSAEVHVSDGNGQQNDYVYFWDNGETQAVAKYLPPGMNCVTVTDNYSLCQATACVFIPTIQPNPIAFEPSFSIVPVCYNDEIPNGQLNYHPLGGTPPFEWEWNAPEGFVGYLGSGSQNYLQEGVYKVTITDHCGEVFEGVYEIVTTYVNINASIHHECDGLNNGAILLDPGATPTNFGEFTFEWDAVVAETNAVTDLNTGRYYVTVTDINGCQREEEFSVRGASKTWAVKEGEYSGEYDEENLILYADACILKQFCGLQEIENSETSTTPLGGYEDQSGCWTQMYCDYNEAELYAVSGVTTSYHDIQLLGETCVKVSICEFWPAVDAQLYNGEYYTVVVEKEEILTDDPFFILTEDEVNGGCTRSTFCFGELQEFEESIPCTSAEVDNDPDGENTVLDIGECDNQNEAYEQFYDNECDVALYCTVGGITERVGWIDGPEVQPCRWEKLDAEGEVYTHSIRSFCNCGPEPINDLNAVAVGKKTYFEEGAVWNSYYGPIIISEDNIPSCGELLHQQLCITARPNGDQSRNEIIENEIDNQNLLKLEGESKIELKVETFQIAPNPFTDNFTIYTDNIKETFQGEVMLINFLGQVVYQKQMTFDKDSSITYVNGFENLIPGIYNLVVMKNKEMVMYEFLVKS